MSDSKTVNHLAQRALLVFMKTKQWSNTVTDRQAGRTIQKAHSASSQSGRFVKQKFSPENLKPIKRLFNDARAYHYKMTLPWSDENFRILPTAKFAEYDKQMRSFQRSIDKAVDEASSKLKDWTDAMRSVHGSLFNEREYPTAEAFKSAYGFEVKVEQVADPKDFRANLDKQSQESIEKTLEAKHQADADRVNTAIAERMHKAVSHMAETLKKPDKTFRDSLVNNIKEIADLVPSLNINGNPDIEKLRTDMQDTLASVDPQTLRDDKETRTDTAEQAGQLADKLKGYM